jgi:hypothetical protein
MASTSSNASPGIGRNRPSTRMRGGEYAVSIKSVALNVTIVSR